AIRKKVMKAVTDSGPTTENQAKPDYIQNLFDLMAVVSSNDTVAHFDELYNTCQIRYGDFKKQLAEDMIVATEPMRSRINDIANDREYVKKVVNLGAEKARASAQKTISCVERLFGISARVKLAFLVCYLNTWDMSLSLRL